MPKGVKGFQKGHKNFSSWRFPKGWESWNKGKKTGALSEEHKEKISKAMVGKVGMENNGYWRGGKSKANGYILIYRPDHPACNCTGYIFEHRLIMEESIGRYLTGTEIIHHINGIRDDNRIENLQMVTSSEHTKIHKPHLSR